MASTRVSNVRAAAFRSAALSFAKACSIGLRSGQIAHCRAGLLDCFLDAFDFVAGKIVHDDDIAWPQDRGEKVFDVGQETRPIDRPIEHTGRGDLLVTQGGNECCRHPMAVGHRREKALTTGRPAIEPDHICLCSRFIKEDKTFRVQIGLARAPLLAGFGDIGAVLFSGAQ